MKLEIKTKKDQEELLQRELLDNKRVKTNIASLNEMSYEGLGKYNYYYIGKYGGPSKYFPLQAMQYHVLYSVLSKITSSIASLPLRVVDMEGHLYDQVTSGEEADRIARVLRMLNRPNAHYTQRYNFFERIASALVMDGNAYMFAPRNRDGDVLYIKLAIPSSVTIQQVGKDRLQYTVQLENENANIKPYNDDIIHIRLGQHYYGYDIDSDLKGLPPLLVLSSSVDIGRQSDIYVRQFFKNSTNGEVFLSIPNEHLNSDQLAQQIKKIEKARRKGSSTISLTEGLDIKFPNAQKSPQDKGLKDLRDQQVRFLASAYGVPPELCGVGDPKSLETTNRMFYRHCLIKYVTVIEEAFTNLLPEGYKFKFDLSQFLRGDMETTLKLVQSGLGGSQTQPYMTRNQALELLGLPTRPEAEFDEVIPAVVETAGGNTNIRPADDESEE